MRLLKCGCFIGLGAVLLFTAAASAGEPTASHYGDLNLKAHYQAIRQAVDQGKLSEAKGRRAEALWLELRKDLIGINARIDTLKLDIAASQGQQQKRAIQRLILASTVKGRRQQAALHQLDRLSGEQPKAIDGALGGGPVKHHDSVKTVAQQPKAGHSSSSGSRRERKTDEAPESNNSPGSDFEVDIGPEDVINDPQHME